MVCPLLAGQAYGKAVGVAAADELVDVIEVVDVAPPV